MSQANYRFAILLMIAGVFCFTLMDVMAKLLAGQVSTVQTLWARYGGQMLIVLVLVAPRLRTVARTNRPYLQAFRALILLAATGFFFSAFRFVTLVEVTVIMQLSPIVIMLGAAIFLGERFGPKRAIAACAALIGAMIVLRPGAENFTPALFLAVAGMLCYSAYNLATRAAGRDEDVWTSMFYTGLAGSAALTLLVPFNWEPVPASTIFPLVAIGAFGTGGQLLLIRALSLAQASLLAPFAYIALIFATFWEAVIFGVLPDPPVIAGALVIVGAGVYVWHRETRTT